MFAVTGLMAQHTENEEEKEEEEGDFNPGDIFQERNDQSRVMLDSGTSAMLP